MKTIGFLIFAAIIVAMAHDVVSSGYCDSSCESVYNACNTDFLKTFHVCIHQRDVCLKTCKGPRTMDKRTTREGRFLDKLKRNLKIIW